jgi:hypothetical protein
MSDKLASALTAVKEAAAKYRGNIVMSSDISRKDRELLTRKNWLHEIFKGWYFLARPDLAEGDTTAWYANYWDFIRVYLERRYGKHYCLSAEASLELQIGKNLFPRQLIIIVPEGGSVTALPCEAAFVTYADPKNIPEERIEFNGVQVMPLGLAICKIAPTYFHVGGENIEIALRSLRVASDIIPVILKYGFIRAAERILGAYQALGMFEEAKEMAQELLNEGMSINPVDPFEKSLSYLKQPYYRSPYAARIELLWKKYRQGIIDAFPKAPGLPIDSATYLERVEDLYEVDAYNSLSIEGYQVTEELIDRVKNRGWDPGLYPEDAKERNALAARGYYEAFQSVKVTLMKILQGASPGHCVSTDLPIWYKNLFSPAVRSNIISSVDIAGYRNDKVYIRNSFHVPPPKEAVLDSMEVFFKCLQEETEASVRAVLGHYIFVFIHPYIDGNGRTARFILNTMLASGGYPWTIVQVKHRKAYIDALEIAHTEGNIVKFTNFIIGEMAQSAVYIPPDSRL